MNIWIIWMIQNLLILPGLVFNETECKTCTEWWLFLETWWQNSEITNSQKWTKEMLTHSQSLHFTEILNFSVWPLYICGRIYITILTSEALWNARNNTNFRSIHRMWVIIWLPVVCSLHTTDTKKNYLEQIFNTLCRFLPVTCNHKKTCNLKR